MKFDIDNMETQIGTLTYEKPCFRKYGRMKDIVFAVQGSGGDFAAKGTEGNTAADPNDTTLDIPLDPNANPNARGDTNVATPNRPSFDPGLGTDASMD